MNTTNTDQHAGEVSAVKWELDLLELLAKKTVCMGTRVRWRLRLLR